MAGYRTIAIGTDMEVKWIDRDAYLKDYGNNVIAYVAFPFQLLIVTFLFEWQKS